jgi:hypothetical protein
MAAGCGATVVSGDSTPKTQTFYIKPYVFFMLIPNPTLKFKKGLPKLQIGGEETAVSCFSMSPRFLSSSSCYFFFFSFLLVFVCAMMVLVFWFWILLVLMWVVKLLRFWFRGSQIVGDGCVLMFGCMLLVMIRVVTEVLIFGCGSWMALLLRFVLLR